MPEITSLTFRDQATGKINDLLIDEDKACAATQNLLAYLAGTLLNYKDEGIEFSPSILLCDSIQKTLQAFPGALTHYIGEALLDASSGRQILKDCAPLANDNWFVFVERSGTGKLKYGVFTYYRLPTAIALQDGISINAEAFSVLVRKISSTTVELRGARGTILSLIFSTVRDSNSDASAVSKFALDCCSKIPAVPFNNEFSTYFAKLLESELAASHGTIIVCQEPGATSHPAMLDAVPVSPALDFYSVFSEYSSSKSAEAILALQRCEELLRGFMRCDGIIAFDTAARVIKYRTFFQAPKNAATQTPVVGGARRRAFEGLKTLVGKELRSALFRSQDGLTIYQGGA